nr:hypothetical protein Itr_chr06CG11690 [Ipomoea trifida]GMD03619.1 hypothetical protein Iba_chr06aCG10590 [Ipomoea batatas]
MIFSLEPESRPQPPTTTVLAIVVFSKPPPLPNRKNFPDWVSSGRRWNIPCKKTSPAVLVGKVAKPRSKNAYRVALARNPGSLCINSQRSSPVLPTIKIRLSKQVKVAFDGLDFIIEHGGVANKTCQREGARKGSFSGGDAGVAENAGTAVTLEPGERCGVLCFVLLNVDGGG